MNHQIKYIQNKIHKAKLTKIATRCVCFAIFWWLVLLNINNIKNFR